MKITIIGGHGKIAQLVTPLLAAAGHDVTSVVRNPDQISDVEDLGATGSLGDVAELDGAGIQKLIAGSDAVLWSAGAGGGSPERTYAVDRDAAIRTMDAAVAEGVDRFVMVSYVGSGRDEVPEDNPFYHYAKAKAEADDHLRGTTLGWTILGPGQLTEEQGTGRIEFGDHVTQGETSRANVAEVIAQAIGRSDLSGATIRFRDGDIVIWEALDVVVRQATGDTVAPLREGQN